MVFAQSRDQKRDYELERVPQDRTSGGGGCSKKMKLLILGAPTGGSLKLPVTITVDNVPVLKTVSISLPATTTIVKNAWITAFTGSAAAIASNQLTVTSSGGSLPSQEMTLVFSNGLKITNVSVGNPVDANGDESLASAMSGGGNPHSIVRQCCG